MALSRNIVGPEGAAMHDTHSVVHLYPLPLK
jgi:hypothetical protein